MRLALFKTMKLKALYLLVLVLVVGCSHEDEDVITSSNAPKQVSFTGSVDKKLVGLWQTANKSQKLTLNEDGSANMKSTINTPKGKEEIDINMQWKIDKNRFYFQKPDMSVDAYELAAKGDELTLKTAKTSMTYLRQK